MVDLGPCSVQQFIEELPRVRPLASTIPWQHQICVSGRYVLSSTEREGGGLTEFARYVCGSLQLIERWKRWRPVDKNWRINGRQRCPRQYCLSAGSAHRDAHRDGRQKGGVIASDDWIGGMWAN